MAYPSPSISAYNSGGEAFKQFQLIGDSKQKAKEEWGLSIARFIQATVAAGTGNNYYSLRSFRFKSNRDWANGRVDIQAKFADKLQMAGKTNYISMGWQCIHICNTIISRLVGRWMQRNERATASATDTISVNDKIAEYKEMAFWMHNKEMIDEMEQQSGIKFRPTNRLIPEDEDSLELWRTQYQRIPEEILYTEGVNDVLDANGWYGIQKEKALKNSAEVGLIGTRTWMDSKGVIYVDQLRPENIVVSYSDYDDFRDSKWRGHLAGLKISELRRKYGKEFGGKLTEEEIFVIAQSSKEYERFDQIRWLPEYELSFYRPYDEWNIDVLFFEVKSLDTDNYKIKKTNNGRLIVEENPSDNQGSRVKEDNYNIYKCAYARTADKILEWGIVKNMIRPQDPTSLGDCEYSYSFYMYQNHDMRNIALPQKIEEPMEQMILARLKIEQVVMRLVPVGAAIDEDAIREIDYGLGEANKEVDPERYYYQTGRIYYRGRDAEGNRVPVPITELKNSGFLEQMNGLIAIYDKHYQILKDELGEDPNLISMAVQPRVTTGNVQASQMQGAAATDYMYRAYLCLMQETSKKVACLLHDSVNYGAGAYRKMLNKKDVAGRVFNIKFDMLPTDDEAAKLEAMINNAIQANANLIKYINPWKVVSVAKQNIEMANLMFQTAMRNMIKAEAEQAQQNTMQQAQAQSQGAIALEQEKQKTQQMALDAKLAEIKATVEGQNKSYTIQAVGAILSKGLPISPDIKDLVDAVKQNIMLPLVMETNQIKQGIAQQQQQGEEQEDPMNDPYFGQDADQGDQQQEGDHEGQPQPQQQPQPQMQ